MTPRNPILTTLACLLMFALVPAIGSIKAADDPEPAPEEKVGGLLDVLQGTIDPSK